MEDSDRTLGSARTFGGPNESPTIVPAEEAPTLPPGTMLAGRYQIVDLLGVGGMGAVYKAFDRQLTRLVALKTILPEMAGTPTALKRFKQEVLLAQSIVHKNVVRIFDIGEDAETNTKFITMDFIEGVDLKNLIKEKGKLPPAEAAGILRQVCQGLEAAHAAGVVHRDLKPQNIMIEKDGHIVVMDFGIARSGESRGATQTGAFLGTPEYMSPEQAKTENVDARSDIFSIGLIFYELLTGKLPFQGKTVLETMFKRTTERAIPPAEIDATVPKGANDIVNKCLQIEREQRYQNVTELLEDLETFDPSKKVGAAERARARLRKASRYRNWAVAAALVLMTVAVVALVLRNRSTTNPVVQHPPETVLIADFTYHTDDPVFDGTLESVVKLGLEGAGFITAYDRTQLNALGAKRVSGRLDDAAAGQIAVSAGVGVVVSGSLDQQGNEFLVRMKATRAVTGNTILSNQATTSKKDQVMFVAGKLVSDVRKALGDETSEASQRFALDTFTNASLEVVHEYITGVRALSNNDSEEALKSYSKVIALDENFAMAYRGMALTYQNMHQYENAEKYVKLAINHIGRMTDREQYRTRASYFALLGNHQQCIDEYSALIKKYPSDASAHNNLAFCATKLRDMKKALEQVGEASAIFPKRPVYRVNKSLYASYGTDFQRGESEARALQELDASYAPAFLALAFAQMGQDQLAQATETYQNLEKLSKAYASTAVAGQADIALYEGRFTEAARILDQAANDDLANKSTDDAATKFAMLAYAHLSQGQKPQAAVAAEKALATSKALKIRFLAGRILAATGETARAKKLADELAREIQSEPQSYGKLIEGEIALQSKNARQALQLFGAGKNLLDTWISRFDLGRANLELGQFPEADSEFARCIERRGEALALFLDESPTFAFVAPVYYYQGRVREEMKNPASSESYKKYQSIRGKSSEDGLLSDVSKRARR